MCVTRQIIKEGNGTDKPQIQDTVKIHYDGKLESTGAKSDPQAIYVLFSSN